MALLCTNTLYTNIPVTQNRSYRNKTGNREGEKTVGIINNTYLLWLIKIHLSIKKN